MIADRVRANTAAHVNRRIDRRIEERVRECAQRPTSELTRRIEALEREWDIERVILTLGPLAAGTGLALGLFRHRGWFAMPMIVLPFLLLHAVQGWAPPLPVLRRLGVRTRQEIDREKYALKVLRGDFATTATGLNATAALHAVSA